VARDEVGLACQGECVGVSVGFGVGVIGVGCLGVVGRGCLMGGWGCWDIWGWG
jgi:hypothetical protein